MEALQQEADDIKKEAVAMVGCEMANAAEFMNKYRKLTEERQRIYMELAQKRKEILSKIDNIVSNSFLFFWRGICVRVY